MLLFEGWNSQFVDTKSCYGLLYRFYVYYITELFS